MDQLTTTTSHNRIQGYGSNSHCLAVISRQELAFYLIDIDMGGVLMRYSQLHSFTTADRHWVSHGNGVCRSIDLGLYADKSHRASCKILGR